MSSTVALATLILDLADRAIKRQDIIAKVQELETNGATPETIQAELQTMMDSAIDEAQDAIDNKT